VQSRGGRDLRSLARVPLLVIAVSWSIALATAVVIAPSQSWIGALAVAGAVALAGAIVLARDVGRPRERVRAMPLSDVDLGDPFAIYGLTPSHGPYGGGTTARLAGRVDDRDHDADHDQRPDDGRDRQEGQQDDRHEAESRSKARRRIRRSKWNGPTSPRTEARP